MIKKVLFLIIFAGLLAEMGFLASTDLSIEAKSKVKKIRIKGYESYGGIIAWVPVSENMNVGFERHYEYKPWGSTLTSFTFTKHGKFSQGQVLDTAEARLHSFAADAVWLGSHAQGSAQSNYPWGLLFAFFMDYSKSGHRMSLMVASFDANGFIVRDWNSLISLDAPGKRWHGVDYSSVGAAIGDNCVGVAINIGFRESYTGKKKQYVKPQAYFLRVDFDGNLLSEPVALKLLNKDEEQSQMVFRPAWNRKRWLVPISNKGWDGQQWKNQANLYASTKSSANKFRVKKFIQTKYYNDLIFSLDNLCLVPAPNTPANLGMQSEDQGDEYMLFVQQRILKYGEQSIDRYKYEYYLYPVNEKGKPAGKKIEVMIPELKHSLKYDRLYFTNEQNNYLSNIVPSYQPDSAVSSGDSEDNWLHLVQAHTIALQPSSHSLPFLIEHQLNFFAINPVDGSVATLDKKSFKWEYYHVRDPILAWNGKQLVLVFNSSTFFADPTKWNSYISVYNR